MCRFKLYTVFKTVSRAKFKYIICVGSSLLQEWEVVGVSCLNTSYVSVQVEKGYIMAADAMFKYIICVGSRNPADWVRA